MHFFIKWMCQPTLRRSCLRAPLGFWATRSFKNTICREGRVHIQHIQHVQHIQRVLLNTVPGTGSKYDTYQQLYLKAHLPLAKYCTLMNMYEEAGIPPAARFLLGVRSRLSFLAISALDFFHFFFL